MAHGQGGAEIRGDASPSLTCNHEAPIVFEPSQITSLHNRSNPRPGDPSPTLAARASDAPHVVQTAHAVHAVHAVHAWQDPISEHDRALPLEARHVQAVAEGGISIRRLTPRECERLQGFPDDYKGDNLQESFALQ